MRGMLHGEEPTAAGPHYAAKAVRNDPRPVQAHMPLLIGGGGENVTLRLVARYGDANNIGFAAGMEGSSARKRRCAGTARRSAVTSARSSAR